MEENTRDIQKNIESIKVAIFYKLFGERREEFSFQIENLLEIAFSDSCMKVYRGISIFSDEMQLWKNKIGNTVMYRNIRKFSSWSNSKDEALRLAGRWNQGNLALLSTVKFTKAIDYSKIYRLVNDAIKDRSNAFNNSLYQSLETEGFFTDEIQRMYKFYSQENEIVVCDNVIECIVEDAYFDQFKQHLSASPNFPYIECYHQFLEK